MLLPLMAVFHFSLRRPAAVPAPALLLFGLLNVLHGLADFQQPLAKRRHMMSRHGPFMSSGRLKKRKQLGGRSSGW